MPIWEGGEAAVAFSSGMGAVTACCWTLLAPGDELIVDETIYGCTFSYFHHGLARFGVKVTHVDMTQPEKLASAIGPRTRLVYCETPANPNMRLVGYSGGGGDYASPARAAAGRQHLLHAVSATAAGAGGRISWCILPPNTLVDMAICWPAW
nr:PLP-dependent transferase [Serratia odorifera]